MSDQDELRLPRFRGNIAKVNDRTLRMMLRESQRSLSTKEKETLRAVLEQRRLQKKPSVTVREDTMSIRVEPIVKGRRRKSLSPEHSDEEDSEPDESVEAREARIAAQKAIIEARKRKAAESNVGGLTMHVTEVKQAALSTN